MAFGLPACHTERYSGKSPDLHVAARKALNALEWPFRENAHGEIVALTKCNMRSWGEEVVISFLPDNSISVTSTCAFPLQLFDWGKNKANVRSLITEIERQG